MFRSLCSVSHKEGFMCSEGFLSFFLSFFFFFWAFLREFSFHLVLAALASEVSPSNLPKRAFKSVPQLLYSADARQTFFSQYSSSKIHFQVTDWMLRSDLCLVCKQPQPGRLTSCRNYAPDSAPLDAVLNAYSDIDVSDLQKKTPFKQILIVESLIGLWRITFDQGIRNQTLICIV